MVFCIECLDVMKDNNLDNLFCSCECSKEYYLKHCGSCNCLLTEEIKVIQQYPGVNSKAQKFCSYKCLNDFTLNQICFECDKEINKELEIHDWVFHNNEFRIICSSKCLKQYGLCCHYCLSNNSNNISKKFLDKTICDKCCLIIKRYEERIKQSYSNII